MALLRGVPGQIWSWVVFDVYVKGGLSQISLIFCSQIDMVQYLSPAKSQPDPPNTWENILFLIQTNIPMVIPRLPPTAEQMWNKQTTTKLQLQYDLHSRKWSWVGFLCIFFLSLFQLAKSFIAKNYGRS